MDSAKGRTAFEAQLGMARRHLGKVKAFAGLAWALRHVPWWLMNKPDSTGARHRAHAFFNEIVKCFGVRIDVKGQISVEPGTLFIMNHISWADIPVMMSILDADFVAKSDMLGWPVIGSLARRLNPVFVARTKAHRSQDQADSVRERLRAGRSVILCPEGTTSDGHGILPFRTSLFAAADAARAIQPLVLHYLQADGQALSPMRQREVAWIDDDELLSGAARVAREATLARVHFLPFVASLRGRKQLAEDVRSKMADAYAAAPNLPR
jgi:lyso-ornithine lipid O-acyltransferase